MDISLVAYSVPQSAQIAIKGMDSYIYNLGKELRQLGHTVGLTVRAPVSNPEEWIHPVKTPAFSWLAYPHFLKGHLRSLQADVFHAEYTASGSALVSAGKRPCVVSVQMSSPFPTRKTASARKASATGSVLFFTSAGSTP